MPPTPASPAPPNAPDAEPPFPPAEAGRSALERRANPRADRHRLVSELRRLDGRSHQEINGWLNRATKVTRVDEATIDQLQRSIDLLVETLAKRSRRRTVARAPARA